VRGVVERVRTRGGIHHDWLRPYVEKNASRYHVWGGRPRGQGMPAFPKGRPAPAFPALKSGTGTLPEGFDPITAASSWYARWTSRCLDVSPQDGTFLAKALFAELAEQMLLSTLTTETGSTVYGLAPATVQVSAPTVEALLDARHLLACDVCQTPVPGSTTTVDELDGAPCILIRCPGRLHRTPKADNFYRRLYDSTEMKRVVAREHTSLLPTKTPARLRDRLQARRHRPAGAQRARCDAHLGDGHRHRRPVHRDARITAPLGVLVPAARRPRRAAHRKLADPGLRPWPW